MHRRRLLLIAAFALATLLSACASTKGEPVASPTASRSLKTTDLTIGETLTTERGNRITVHAFEAPARTSATPPPDHTFVAADVEACAGPNPDANTGVGPQLFLAATETGDGYPGLSSGVRLPALQQTMLSPNGCVRGWVSFRVPDAQRTRTIFMVSTEIGRWRIT